MTVWKRAWYYVARKKEKTIVVLVLLITIMILLNTVLAMQKETDSAQAQSSGIKLSEALEEESQNGIDTGENHNKDEIIQQLADQANAKELEEGSSTMRSLLGIMVIVLIGTSVLVMSFLQIFRIRERKYEIGVMVSVGCSKGEIMRQLTAEMLYIMAMAVIPSIAVSAGLLKLLGYGIYAACFLEAFGIWLGTVMISLIVAAFSILTKNAKKILAQID